MGNLNMNLDEIEETEVDISPVPPGKYVCEIADTEVKVNSKGTGKICKVRSKIVDGEYKGKSIFMSFNVTHESTKAQQIGKGQFKSLCKSCGIASGEIEDSSELHGRLFGASVKLEDRGEYGEQNRVAYTFPIIKNSTAFAPAPIEEDTPDFMKDENCPV